MKHTHIIYDSEADNDQGLADALFGLDLDVGDEIVIIGYLDLWDGKRTGFRLTGTSLLDVAIADAPHEDYTTVYVDDGGDLWSDETHHDGTNCLLYRAFRKNISRKRKLDFLDKVAWNRVTRKDITACTRRIGTYAAEAYGWKLKGQKAV